MINMTGNNVEDKTPVRCAECDREMGHYVTFTSSINEERNVCWQCTDREEKGYNTKRGWRRETRDGDIPK